MWQRFGTSPLSGRAVTRSGYVPRIWCGSATVCLLDAPGSLKDAWTDIPLVPGGSSFCSCKCPSSPFPLFSFWNQQVGVRLSHLTSFTVAILLACCVGGDFLTPDFQFTDSLCSPSPSASPERLPVCRCLCSCFCVHCGSCRSPGPLLQHLILCYVSNRFQQVSFKAVYEGPAV